MFVIYALTCKSLYEFVKYIFFFLMQEMNKITRRESHIKICALDIVFSPTHALYVKTLHKHTKIVN